MIAISEIQVTVTNAQRALPISAARVKRLMQCAIRTLRIRAPGTFAITFISDRRMRTLNKRFLRHDRPTDVLSFRYDTAEGPRPKAGPPASGLRPTVGEILIAPAMARTYAREHGIAYTEELSRYVVHGLLHWLGHDDRTPSQQRKMRAREDRILAQCATESSMTKSQSSNNHQ